MYLGFGELLSSVGWTVQSGGVDDVIKVTDFLSPSEVTAGVFGVLIALIGAYFTGKVRDRDSKVSIQNKVADVLTRSEDRMLEEISTLKQLLDVYRGEIDSLLDRVDSLEKSLSESEKMLNTASDHIETSSENIVYLTDYVIQLQKHIDNELPPPPPTPSDRLKDILANKTVE